MSKTKLPQMSSGKLSVSFFRDLIEIVFHTDLEQYVYVSRLPGIFWKFKDCQLQILTELLQYIQSWDRLGLISDGHLLSAGLSPNVEEIVLVLPDMNSLHPHILEWASVIQEKTFKNFSSYMKPGEYLYSPGFI